MLIGYNFVCNSCVIEEVHLQENKMIGPIPSTIGTLHKLNKLLLDNNGYSGTIPPQLAELTGLREFRAFNNQLTGTMPPGICTLKKQHELKFVALDCDDVKQCTCCDECL
jgi:kinase